MNFAPLANAQARELRLHLRCPTSHKQDGDPRSVPKAAVHAKKNPAGRGFSVCRWLLLHGMCVKDRSSITQRLLALVSG